MPPAYLGATVYSRLSDELLLGWMAKRDMAAKDAQSLVTPAPANPPAASATGRDGPLCVDLDGTLVRTDCLWENAVQILFRHPRRLVGILLGFWQGKAWIK